MKFDFFKVFRDNLSGYSFVLKLNLLDVSLCLGSLFGLVDSNKHCLPHFLSHPFICSSRSVLKDPESKEPLSVKSANLAVCFKFREIPTCAVFPGYTYTLRISADRNPQRLPTSTNHLFFLAPNELHHFFSSIQPRLPRPVYCLSHGMALQLSPRPSR